MNNRNKLHQIKYSSVTKEVNRSVLITTMKTSVMRATYLLDTLYTHPPTLMHKVIACE